MSTVLKNPFPDLPVDKSQTFDQFVELKLQKFKDKVAVIDSNDGRQYKYDEILNLTRLFKECFGKLGDNLTKGDVFSLCLFNCVEILPIALSLTSFGLVFNTSNPNYTADELIYQYNLVKSRCVITTKQSVDKIKQVKAKCESIKNIIVLDAQVEGCIWIQDLAKRESCANPKTVKVNPNDTAFLFSSSGTTGLPKQIELSHLNLVANLTQLSQCESTEKNMKMFCPGENDLVLSVFPYFHLAGLLNGLVWVLKEGGCSIILPKYETKIFLSVIEKFRPNVLIAPPPVHVFLTKSPAAEAADLSSIKTVVNRAAPIAPSVVEALCQRLHLDYVINGYGMTELSTIGLMIPVSDLSRKKLGSCGVPLPNSLCKVIDDEGKLLGPNQRGQLLIKGLHVTKGYLYNESATRESITEDGWLKTGDICYYDEDGFFYIVDRIKELMKVKAFQVAPAEIEQCLLQHPHVADVAVVGILDDYAGELPFAFVVKKANADILESEIRKFVADRLADYKQLKGGVRFVEAIPKNPSGKILRRVLRDEIRAELAKK